MDTPEMNPALVSRSREARHVPLLLVTGAPGAGKSTLAEAMLGRSTDALIFDADWLLEPVSALVGQSLAEASQLWPSYRWLWLEVLHMVAKNQRAAVLFAPLDRADLATLPASPWTATIHWCLLDCDDATRVARLQTRGWTRAAIDEAVADGHALRDQIEFRIDTSRAPLEAAMEQLQMWIARYWP